MAVGLFKNSGQEIKKNKNDEELVMIDGIILSNYEIIRDLIKTFKEKNNEMEFFLTIVDNQHQDSMSEIVSSFFQCHLLILICYVLNYMRHHSYSYLKKLLKGYQKLV